MNFMFFIYIPLVHSALHNFMTTYTGQNGQVVAGTPEISAVTTLDGRLIDHYDSDTGKLIPKQDWMNEFASGDRWKKYIEIRERVQQISKRFSQSHGVHMYQRMYGCVWDDKTEVSHGIDEYNYDGQRFISLDLEEGKYIAHVTQAELTVQKWNNDTKQLDFLKQYYKHECTDWLKELLNFSRATFKKTGIVSELPGQSLTEPIKKNLTVDETKGSGSSLDASYFMNAAIIILPILILIALYALCKNWKKLKSCQQDLYYRDNSTLSDNSADNQSGQHLMAST